MNLSRMAEKALKNVVLKKMTDQKSVMTTGFLIGHREVLGYIRRLARHIIKELIQHGNRDNLTFAAEFEHQLKIKLFDQVKDDYPLVLEHNPSVRDESVISTNIAITPPIENPEYWMFRVKVSSDQAIVAFPKFFTMGIGFQVENDNYNTNLPYKCGLDVIWDHIRCNKGNSSIPDSRCIEALKMVIDACVRFKNAELKSKKSNQEKSEKPKQRKSRKVVST